MQYIICLIILLLIYAVVILNMKRFKNTKITNLVFVLITFCCYIPIVFITLHNDGVHDWNFKNTLPTANVSPFMFATLPLYFILPKSIKKYYLTLISLLSVGMILSVAFGCIFNAARNYRFIPHFTLDFIAHMSLSLFGVYLVKSKQISLKLKECLIGGSIIVCAALIMLVLNIIFNTSFFGLNLNGKHNIYNNVLVSNSYLSALIYFAGLIGIMVIGYFYLKLIMKIKKES